MLRRQRPAALAGTLAAAAFLAAPVLAGTEAAGSAVAKGPTAAARAYPVHRSIRATTFWVGEVYDPSLGDEGQNISSTYDGHWRAHYGGCDGVLVRARCRTERRVASNGYFPRHMRPRENPFYVALPYDDLNDATGFRLRARVVPWARDPGYAGHARDRGFSYLKNRWVRVSRGERVAYAQLQDAGPYRYHDHSYVFGSARPANTTDGGSGIDVSPAVVGALGWPDPNGVARVDWRFVEQAAVPRGPWKRRITTRGPSG